MAGRSSCEWRYAGIEEEFNTSAFNEIENVFNHFNVEASSLSNSIFSSRINWMFHDFLHCPESLLTISHHLLQSFFDRFLVLSA